MRNVEQQPALGDHQQLDPVGHPVKRARLVARLILPRRPHARRNVAAAELLSAEAQVLSDTFHSPRLQICEGLWVQLFSPSTVTVSILTIREAWHGFLGSLQWVASSRMKAIGSSTPFKTGQQSPRGQ